MMVIIAVLLIIIVAVVLLRRTGRSEATEAPSEDSHSENQGSDAYPSDCFCDNKTLQTLVNTEIIYFDDEELDAYKGRTEYSEAEINQFQEVLFTLRPNEVADWLRSLELRDILLPEQLRDEVVMLINDSK